MPNFQFDENLTELCPETRLNLCRFLQNAPIKNMLLKDGRRITDAAVWNEISKELIIPAMNDDNGRTFSLIQACLKNDEETVKSFLTSAECDINDIGVDGETTLARAVAKNSVPIVELLLQRGADPNMKEKKIESTPLIEAAKEGFDCVVKLLLQYGASVSQTTNTGYTALHYAAANGHLECVKLLLEHGSPLEEQNENGHTPLMEATSNGHIEVARCLIEHGANINTHSTEFKESALTLASYKGHAEMVKFLLDAGASHEHRTDEMHTALMEAAMEGHVEVAKLLLAHGANVNIPQDSFESPLTLAACGGHTELVHLLIGYEADIEEVNDEGYTPLMEAAREGHEDTVAVLLAAGADVNAKTEETQETALTLAACGGFIEVCEMLLKAGADIEVGNTGCSTPLMEAAQEGHLELVRRLLHQGANVNSITTSGDTALHYAAENGHVKVCKELLNWGATLGQPLVIEGCKTPLMKAARSGHLEVVQLLVEWGFSVNQPTSQNEATALSLACNGGHVQVVEYLLKNGANPHYELRDGCTMLIEAARSGSPAVLRMILDYPKSLSMPMPTVHPPPPPPPLPQQPTQHPQLQNGSPGIAVVSPQLGEAASAVMHQHAAAAAAVAIHQQQQRAGLAVRQALSAHPPHHPQLKEALANAYAAGWADGAASRAQQSPLASQSLAGEPQAGASEKTKEKGQVKPSKATTTSSSSEKPSARPQQLASTATAATTSTMEALAVGEETTIDSIGDLSHAACTDELSSRLMALFHDWKGDSTEFLHRLGTVMTCPINAVRAAGRQPSDSQDASVAAAAFTNLQRLMKCAAAAGGGGSATACGTGDLMEVCQAAVRDLFAPPPPPPPTNTSSPTTTASPSFASSSSLSGSGGGGGAGSTRSSASSSSSTTSSSSSGSSSVLSSSTQLIDTPSIVGPPNAAYYQQVRPVAKGACEDVATCPLEVAHSLAQAITLSSPSVVPPCQRSSGATAPPPPPPSQQGLTPTVGPALYDQLMSCAAAAVAATPQPPPPPPPTVQSSAGAINQQMDINACIESSMESALTLACSGGFVDLARLLLDRGADKEHRDKKSHTPLHTAVYANQRQIVSLLLDYGADIEAQVERTKDTALSIACSHGRLEITEDLLNRGANKEHRNFSDYTPLSLAASGGFVDVIQLLLRHGAEINSRTGSKLGISPLMLASMNGYTDAVRVLLEHGSDINAQIETNRNTALTLACFQGQHEVVKLLVERKANIEHRAKTGLTPLMEAASGNHVKVGYILLEHGADVNALPVLSSRDTALTIAADKGKTEFVNLLLNHGAVVEARNKKGATSLWLACNGGHLDVVESLISAHADVNSQDNRKVSCLMAAFRKGHVKVVSLLVQHVTQFPSDKDCLRHIKVIATDKELAERCQQCRKIISAAKEKQEGEARKNADVLLEQIEQEEEERANKEAMQARKRERKRNKRKAKQESAALAAAAAEAAKVKTTTTVTSGGVDGSADESVVSKKAISKTADAHSAAKLASNESPDPSSTSSDQPAAAPVKKKGKHQSLAQVEPQTKPDSEREAELAKSLQSAQVTESKREKHRTKKQAQRTSKRTEVANAAPAAGAASPSRETAAMASPPASVASCDPPASFDCEAAYWDPTPFEHSPDAGSVGNNSEWLVVQPASSNRSHRSAAANQSDAPSSSATTDWKTTGPSGSGSSAKRKVALSVSKHDIGKIIGQGGAVVSALRNMSGIQIDIESARGDEVTERMVYLRGPADTVQRTYQIIQDLLSGALAGNEVIAKSKSSKLSQSLGFPAPFSTSSSVSTRTGSTTSRRTAGNGTASKIPSLQSLPTPQPLMAKLATPLTLKASTSNNSNVAKIGATSNSWVGTRAPIQKGNFASVAAAGVFPTTQAKDTKKGKSTAPVAAPSTSQPPLGTPVSLLAVTIAALTSTSTNNSVFSTAPVTILDDQSFPPLSTSTTSFTPTVSTSKPPDSPPRKMSLPTPQSEEQPVSTSLGPLPTAIVEKPQAQTPVEPLVGGSSVETPLPQAQKSTPVSRTPVAPIGSSRPFARAPGSERSANRHAGAAAATTAFITPVITSLTDSAGGSAVTPTKRVSVSSAFGNESLFSTPSEAPTSINSAPSQPQASTQPTDSLDSLFATSQHPTLQHQPPSSQFDSASSHGMWSDFSANGTDSAFGGGGSYDYTAPTPNYAHLLQNTMSMRNFDSTSSTIDDQPLTPLFPSHLQSSYRLSQQTGNNPKLNGAPPSEAYAAAFSAAAAVAGHGNAFPQRDFSLFNGLANGGTTPAPSAAASAAASGNTTSSAYLPSRLNPVHQQLVQSQNLHTKSQQAYMHHHQSFGLGLSSSQQPVDQSCYLGGSGQPYPGGGPSNYGFPSVAMATGGGGGSPAVQQPPHPQPTPIGAERRRCHQASVASSSVVPSSSASMATVGTNQSPFSGGGGGGGGQSAVAAAAANQALMALLMQQQQQQQQQSNQDPSGSNASWSTPLHHQSPHPAFWSQNVGGGLGVSGGPSHQQQQQQSLMASTAAAVAALANLCPWPNQSAPGGGGGASANPAGLNNGGTNWMMPPAFPPSQPNFPPQIRPQQQQQQQMTSLSGANTSGGGGGGVGCNPSATSMPPSSSAGDEQQQQALLQPSSSQ
uniref:ANK_REP_REGION domain-containing protein n=2 Tax=Mesocestoides corti TaxID=53468 RepID=A0A5K3ETX1_MESCO